MKLLTRNPGVQRFKVYGLFFALLLNSFQSNSQWAEIHKPNLAGYTIFDIHSHGDTAIAVGYIADQATSVFKSVILTSSDNGASWDQEYFDGIFLKSMDFKPDGTGFIGGFGMNSTSYILRSDDGGISWDYVFTDNNNGGVSYLMFENDSIGYASGYGSMQFFTPNLYKTSDGGETWAVELISAPQYTTFDKLTFIDTDAYALSSVYFNGSILGKELNYSADFGRTWIKIHENDDNVGAMAWLTPLKGFLVTDQGEIQKSTDGGVTWNEIYGSGGKALYGIVMNDSIGFAVGEGGLILRTTDQGSSWRKQTSQTNKNIVDVSVYSKRSYAVGEDGIILQLGGTIPTDTTSGGSGNPGDWPVGIFDPISDPILFFPNPVSGGVVHIERNNEQIGPVEVRFYNTTGQMVLSEKVLTARASLDLSKLPTGTYLYTATDDEKIRLKSGLISVQ